MCKFNTFNPLRRRSNSSVLYFVGVPSFRQIRFVISVLLLYVQVKLNLEGHGVVTCRGCEMRLSGPETLLEFVSDFSP